MKMRKAVIKISLRRTIGIISEKLRRDAIDKKLPTPTMADTLWIISHLNSGNSGW